MRFHANIQLYITIRVCNDPMELMTIRSPSLAAAQKSNYSQVSTIIPHAPPESILANVPNN